MKNKFMKKTLAAALALTLVSGAMPTVIGRNGLTKPAIVAHAEANKVSLTNVNVALDDSISLKYYATKDSVDSAVVTSVTLDGPNDDITIANTDFKSATIGGTDYYVFSYPLYATQLDENVTIQFLGTGNTVIAINNNGNSYSYKVNNYCDYVASNYNSLTQYEYNAVDALKKLGIAADNYFSDSQTTINLYGSFALLNNFTPSFDSAYGKLSLVLDSKLSARLYIDGLNAGEKSDDSAYTAIAGKDGKACFEITNLAPTKLGDVNSINYKNTAYTFSALSYCARTYNSTNSKTANVAKAVYNYYTYVKDYSELVNSDHVVKVLSKAEPNKVFDERRFAYESDTTWAQLAQKVNNSYKISISENNIVEFDGNLLLCDENKKFINPNDVIDANKTYYYIADTSYDPISNN